MISPYESVNNVEFELTDRCNAACPMCSRYVKGVEAPFIKNMQITLDDFKQIIPVDFIGRMVKVWFCGSYGDPINARDLIPIIRYMLDINSNISIQMSTNVSARSAKWWTELGEIVQPGQGIIRFAIDGLEDTNHIYRKNTDWNIIMRNAQAFLDAGGMGEWRYLPFRHNEHQIEEARELAAKMGFARFSTKLSDRFGPGETQPVYDSKGEFEYNIHAASTALYQDPSLTKKRTEESVYFSVPAAKEDEDAAHAADIINMLRRKGMIPNKERDIASIDSPEISCLAAKNNTIFVAANGNVYPCCWIAGAHGRDTDLILDEDLINLWKLPLKEIIEGSQFEAISQSWETGSISRCVKACSRLGTKNVKRTQLVSF